MYGIDARVEEGGDPQGGIRKVPRAARLPRWRRTENYVGGLVMMNATSIGFLMFYVGQNVTEQKTCYNSFFPDFPFVDATASLACKFVQGGTGAEKQCWNRLMREKVQAIANSPFDTSIIVDTDVWHWTQTHALKTSVEKVASAHAIAGVIDPWRGIDIVENPSLNGGFLIVRKSAALNAFWVDVLRFLDMHPDTNEQWAYMSVLPNHRAVNVTFLHHTWSCGDQVANRALHNCIFRHSHSIERCPPRRRESSNDSHRQSHKAGP